jgi:hypothetical protein
MSRMRSHALTLGSFLCCAALPVLAGCDNDDYQVAVSWTLNGKLPTPALCSELGIARGRFEVRTASGKKLRTLESDCEKTVVLSNGYEYGGFLTTRTFQWDRDYEYTLTLVDAAGNPVSSPGEDAFYVDSYDGADIYELGFLDYLNHQGTAAALSGEWSVGSGPDIAAACTSFKIAKVRILVASTLDTDMVDTQVAAEANCSDGKFVSPGKVLATGDYLFKYVAVSDIGAVVEEGTPFAATTDFDIVLPRQMFLSK